MIFFPARRQIFGLITGTVCIGAGAIAAADDMTSADAAVAVIESVCLKTFPDFDGAESLAELDGMSKFVNFGTAIYLNREKSVAMTLTPRISLLGIDLVPHDCIVFAYDTAIDTVLKRIGTEGTSLTHNGERLSELGTGTTFFSSDVIRGFEMKDGQTVYMLISDEGDGMVSLSIGSERSY